MPPLNTEDTPLAMLTRCTGLDEQTFIDLFGAEWTDAGRRGFGGLGATHRPGDDIVDVSVFLFGTRHSWPSKSA